MRLGLIAEKIGMSRYYDSLGVNHAVTVLKVNDSKIIDLKTLQKDGYSAVRLSSGTTKKKLNKSVKGYLKKNNISPFSTSKEFRVDTLDDYKVGNRIEVTNFMEGQYVDVSSNSKGKGFAGGMKRHNFGGNRATHGVSISHRSHGSTGQCQDPGKVFKGKKMAGRLGNVKKTVQNLKILKIDTENSILLVKGAVPGHKGAVIKIFDSVKKNQKIILNNTDSNLDSTSVSKEDQTSIPSPEESLQTDSLKKSEKNDQQKTKTIEEDNSSEISSKIDNVASESNKIEKEDLK
jgi:large subunit ribosomal protein L3